MPLVCIPYPTPKLGTTPLKFWQKVLSGETKGHADADAKPNVACLA